MARQRSTRVASASSERSEADLLAFGAIDVLELAEADLHARRLVAGVQRIGRRCPCGNAAFDKRFGDPPRLIG
jgi:hypothetical protein